ncbi:UNVERIFIED_CONTAM: protein ORANGE-LIKE, chloroplastic [Sesamum radiatum]|uniref:Protein ORANGE-LIKE, chloroplastic n=1 Tax=Sesamum radiatum TaxID=300843 RepID=A0AAW2NM61_SESRA
MGCFSLTLYSPLPSPLNSSKPHNPIIFFPTPKTQTQTASASSQTLHTPEPSSSPIHLLQMMPPLIPLLLQGTARREGPETVQDFVQMQLQEIQDNIRSRRNKIFLLMEEVRRLRVQQRIKSMKAVDENCEVEDEMPDIPSSIPFLPHVTPKTLKQLYLTSFSFISGIIVFGGLVAPILELKLGLGGTSYADFIHNMHLPMQLSQVDPIVASFAGGAVGVISALMLLEINNVEQQEEKMQVLPRNGGLCLSTEPIITSATDRPLRAPTTKRCLNCSGAGKVMCPTCLCTGMIMASEHDPRIEPFD